VEAIRLVDSYMTVEWLMKLVLQEEAGVGYDPRSVVGIVVATIEQEVEERGGDLTMPGWHLRRWLMAEDWETRAERAMGLYAEGMGLPADWTMPDRLNDMVKRVGAYEDEKGPLPERVKQAVVSAYNRLLFYREKKQEIERREVEQALKRGQRGQRQQAL
jgi:hypothetical protein